MQTYRNSYGLQYVHDIFVPFGKNAIGDYIMKANVGKGFHEHCREYYKSESFDVVSFWHFGQSM